MKLNVKINQFLNTYFFVHSKSHSNSFEHDSNPGYQPGIHPDQCEQLKHSQQPSQFELERPWQFLNGKFHIFIKIESKKPKSLTHLQLEPKRWFPETMVPKPSS